VSEESTSIRRSMEARSMEADIEERGASRGAHRAPPVCHMSHERCGAAPRAHEEVHEV
jgi:hypothetical protein